MPWRPDPDRDNGFDFPSLGHDLLEWWADHLPSPRDPSQELIFTPDQARQLIEWYRLDPDTGSFVYRRGYSRRSKGRGKSPVEAAKAIAEFAGPVRFAGWDATGAPVGRPWGTDSDPLPWVQVGAVSEDQTDNTWSVVHYFLTENDGKAADELRVDAGLTRCFLRDRPGAKCEPVTAAAGSREGQPITYAVLDETHLWTPRNGGRKLASTLRRNVAKMDGRSYETTNAFVPGEGSVAEQSCKAVNDGAPGILADEVEAPREVDGVPVTAEAPTATLKAALTVAYGDAWWVDTDRLVAEVRDPANDWNDSARFFFNWNVKGGGAAVDPRRWAELVNPTEVPDGCRVGLGFDGSISEDSTFLVGCTELGQLFVIAGWERPRYDDGRPVKEWRVPRLEVGDAVRAAFKRWDVGRMFGDPPKWATELESWADEFRIAGKTDEERERVLEFPTNSPQRMSRAVDRFLTAVREGALSHTGDERLAAHVAAAHLKKVREKAEDDDQRTMYVIVKGDDGRKIDACIAAVLAYEAAMTMPEKPKARELFLAVT
jgi:hypothetical protein